MSARRRARWFLPAVPDLLGLLEAQGSITVEGLEAFERWANGDGAAAERVRALEHAADTARRRVIAELRSAFVTPVEPEDLFELSERLDAVLNRAKDLVREAEVLAMPPDGPMAQMATLLLSGVRHLVATFPVLARDPDRATAEADAAVADQRALERVYRRAMSALLEQSELREVTGRRELHRRFARTADTVEAVADRVWYTVVKRA